MPKMTKPAAVDKIQKLLDKRVNLLYDIPKVFPESTQAQKDKAKRKVQYVLRVYGGVYIQLPRGRWDVIITPAYTRPDQPPNDLLHVLAGVGLITQAELKEYREWQCSINVEENKRRQIDSLRMEAADHGFKLVKKVKKKARKR